MSVAARPGIFVIPGFFSADECARYISGWEAAGFEAATIRHEPGQYFAPHTDGSFRRPNGEESRLTLLVYLNDYFAGGETAFADDVVAPSCGMALVFRHELLHEGRVVVNGSKYVLRSDVMFNPLGRISG